MTGPLSLVATDVTRPVFEGVGPLGKAVFYAVAAVSTVVFCLGGLAPGAQVPDGPGGGALAGHEGGPGFEAAQGRKWGVGRQGQPWDRRGALLHLVGLCRSPSSRRSSSRSTPTSSGKSPRLVVGHQDSFFHGTFFLIFTFVVDTMGFAFLVSLIYMAVRRGVRRPWRLGYQRAGMPAGGYSRRRLVEGDWLFLGLLIVILVTAYLLTGLRILGQGMPWFTVFSPFGRAVAEVLSGLGMSPARAVGVHTVVWWVHAALALSFVAVRPVLQGHAHAGRRGERARSRPLGDPQPAWARGRPRGLSGDH